MSLESLRPLTEPTELRRIVKAAVETRTPLCRFYGPVAENLATSSECDPEAVCTLLEQLQIGHKIEMFLPGRAWLVQELCQKVNNNLSLFDGGHAIRLLAVSFVPQSSFHLAVAKLYSMHVSHFCLRTVGDALSVIRGRDDPDSRAVCLILRSTADTIEIRNSNAKDDISAAAENAFVLGVAKYLNGKVLLSNEEKQLRKAVANRLCNLSNIALADSPYHEPVISNGTVLAVLGYMGSCSSSDPGVRDFLKGLLLGRERDEIDSLLVGVGPLDSIPPPPPKEFNSDEGLRVVPMQPVKSSEGSYNRGLDIFQALACLGGMHDDVSEVKTVLSFLCHEISVLLSTGKAIEVHDTLFLSAVSGMRNLNCNSITVRRLLGALKQSIIVPSPPGKRVNFVKKISNAVSGLRKMSGKHFEVTELLNVLVPTFSIYARRSNMGEAVNSPFLNEKDVNFLLSGLKSFGEDAAAMHEYLASINMLLSQQNGRIQMSAQGAAVALYSIRQCSSETESARTLLTYIRVCIEQCQEAMTAQQVSMCLYGMQNMSTACPEVLHLVSVLGRCVDLCVESLGPQDIAMCMMGMRRMTNAHTEVRILLNALTKKLSTSTALSFQSQELAMTLSGFQSMSSNCAEVRDILERVQVMAVNCSEPLTSQGIAMCMQGFQLLHSEHAVVLKMISVVKKLVEISPDAVLTVQGVVMCLRGFRYLNCEHVEVRALLKWLVPKIEQSKEALDPVDFLNCMRGTKAMDRKWCEVDELFRVLKGKIPPLQGEMWWQEILRSEVYDTDNLIDDLHHYSKYNVVFRDLLEYVIREDPKLTFSGLSG